MKTYKLKLILTFILILFSFMALLLNINGRITTYAVNFENEPTLEIIGKSNIEVNADSAEVFICIENVDMNLSVSKDKSQEQFNQAKQALINIGIYADDIKISSFSTNPSYDYSSGKTLIGYFAILNFSYKLFDLEKYEESIDALIDVGITDINYVNFSLSNANEVYQTALNNALEQAIENAKNLLEKDAITVLNIEEESNFYTPLLYKNSSMNENIDTTVEICASVKIVCK